MEGSFQVYPFLSGLYNIVLCNKNWDSGPDI